MTRTPLALAAILLTALTLSACGEKTDRIQPTAAQAETLRLQLDTAPNADHVGLYAAIADGDFTRAGLRVSVQAPGSTADPLAEVEDHAVDVAIVSEPELMIARSKGATVLSFGAVVQRPLTSFVSLAKRHIRGVAGLRGRTLGVTGVPYQSALLTTALAHAGVPARSVKQVDVGRSGLTAALLSGRVAATFGGFSDDVPLQLRRAKRIPSVIPVTAAGVPSYSELVLVTSETFFADHTNELRRFVQALGRGYAAVRSDPAAGVRALDAANPSLNPALTAAAVRAALPAFLPQTDRPFGWQPAARWNAFGRWMVREHLISGDPPAWYQASTNQLLAGQGP